MSSVSASAHSAPCTAPSANEAPTSSATPAAVLPLSAVMTDLRSAGSSWLATNKRASCAIRTDP